MLICEKLGKEPDPSKMPPTISEFPEEVQVAFFIYGLLPDRYDSMGGFYQGKDISALGTLLDIYGVEDTESVTTFIMIIQRTYVELINADLERKRKAEMRKAKNG